MFTPINRFQMIAGVGLMLLSSVSGAYLVLGLLQEGLFQAMFRRGGGGGFADHTVGGLARVVSGYLSRVTASRVLSSEGSPSLLLLGGGGGGDDDAGVDDTFRKVLIAGLVDLVRIAAATLVCWRVDRWGRVRTLQIAAAGQCISAMLIVLSLETDEFVGHGHSSSIVGPMIQVGACFFFCAPLSVPLFVLPHTGGRKGVARL